MAPRAGPLRGSAAGPRTRRRRQPRDQRHLHPPRLPLRWARISQSAAPLARLTGHQTAPGPVPAQGVAIINQLLADGTGPLYRQACADDLSDIIQNAARALTC